MSVLSPAPDAPLAGLTHRLRRLVLCLVGHILVEDGDLITRWRARLTAAFMLAVATFGLIPVVPTLAVTIARGLWAITVIDGGLYLLLVIMLLSRRVSNRARNLFLVSGAFTVGAMAVVFLGPASGTLAWLYTGVFLCAFLFGPRGTAVLGGAIVTLLATVAVGIRAGWFAWAEGNPGALEGWLLTSVNFAFLIAIFALANGVVMRLLEREERARIEAEARLAEARRHEALGALASGIAHDFNNLLVPVLVHVESVREALRSPSPDVEGMRDALGEAGLAAVRARELVQRILAFGRGLDVERQLVDVAVAAQETVALARHTAPVGVTVGCTFDDPPLVRASCIELHQVMLNLIANAVNAVGESGSVSVHADRVVSADGTWLRLAVRDSGVGMDARTRERIFDPYFSTKGPGKGTGLGLSIVRSLVDALGGRIGVESAPGAGTTFTILLPAAAAPLAAPRLAPTPAGLRAVTARTPAAAEAVADADIDTIQTAAATRSPTDAPPGAERILLVDDEEVVRRATARLLQSLGHAVTAVPSAAAALDALHTTPDAFTLLLTDFKMPGASGTDLARTVHARVPTLPVILMSGDVDDVDREGSLPAALQRLQKPFSRAELADAITRSPGRRPAAA